MPAYFSISCLQLRSIPKHLHSFIAYLKNILNSILLHTKFIYLFILSFYILKLYLHETYFCLLKSKLHKEYVEKYE